MLCSDRTSTLTHNILTIESKLPSCETSGHARTNIVTIEPKLPWGDTAVDVRSDWSDQVDGVIHILYQLFGVGALAHRGLSLFIGGLCGDHSPHRTTMTQTKYCPILRFGSWWLHLPVVSHGTEDCVPLAAPRPGAIAHSRPHLSPRAPFFSLSSFVSPLRLLGLGFLLSRGSVRSLSYYSAGLLCRYGRTSGQPSSSSLARRACVRVLPFSSPAISVYGYSFSWSSPTGTP